MKKIDLGRLTEDAEDVYTEAGKVARWIVLRRVGITSAVGTVLGALAVAGLIPDELSTRVDGWVATGLVLVTTLFGAVWAQTATTPADPLLGPTSSNGQLMVEAKVAAQLLVDHAAPTREASPAASPVPAPVDEGDLDAYAAQIIAGTVPAGT